MFWIIVFVLLVACLVWSRNSIYRKIENEIDDYNVRRYVFLTKLNPMNKAIDFYRLGCIYDYIYKSPNTASNYYKKAIKKININRPNKRDAFVLQKVTDRVGLDVYLDVDEAIQPYLTKSDIEPQKIELENRINWEPDTNNVHDTNINDEVVAKINKLKLRTYAISFEEAERIFHKVSFSEAEQKFIPNAQKTIDHIKKYNQFLNSAQMHEKDIFALVVADIDRDQRRQTLFENLLMNLNDASSGGTVCLNGRVARIMDSYTDGEHEKFMTMQAWKNELFEKARKIRDGMIETFSEEDKKKYEDDDSEILKKVVDQMKLMVAASGAPPRVVSSVSEDLEHSL